MSDSNETPNAKLDMRHIQYQGETLPPSPLVLAFHLVLGKFHIYFEEGHCQAKKAGMTIKDPLIQKNEDGTQELKGFRTTIRLRVRIHPSSRFWTRVNMLEREGREWEGKKGREALWLDRVKHLTLN